MKNTVGFMPGGSDGKESACNAGNLGSIPGLGRIPGEGNGNPLQYSCLENPMGRGVWQATVHGVTESRTRLSNQHFSSPQILERKKLGQAAELDITSRCQHIIVPLEATSYRLCFIAANRMQKMKVSHSP